MMLRKEAFRQASVETDVKPKHNCLLNTAVLIALLSLTVKAESQENEEQFDATGIKSIAIEGVSQDTMINVARSKKITLTGRPPNSVDAYIIDGQLVINGARAKQVTEHVGVTLKTGNGVVILASGIGDVELNPTPLEIHVPPNFDITINNSSGKIETAGKLGVLNYTGSGRINVDAVTDLNLTLSRNGRAQVKHIKGDLTVAASGNSRVTLQTGKVSRAIIAQKGNSRVRFAGWVDALDATMNGNSRLEFGGVTHIEKLQTKRNAQLKIRDLPKTFSDLAQ